jgi:Zn-dependent protease with chaperone function
VPYYSRTDASAKHTLNPNNPQPNHNVTLWYQLNGALGCEIIASVPAEVTEALGAGITGNSNLQSVAPPLPYLAAGKKPSPDAIRDHGERIYFRCLIAFNAVFFAGVIVSLLLWRRQTIVVGLFGLSPLISDWFLWKWAFPTLYGQSIRIGPHQYPHLYRLFRAAVERLEVREPVVLVFNGNGLLGLLLKKRFTRRGVITLTSNLFDALQQRPSSRELMMIIGAQLGHLVAGHYRLWFFTDYVGALALGLHAAWKRRCQYTADRVGLMLAGDTFAAEQGLLVLTVGQTLAPGTNIEELPEQREDLYDDVWSWLRLIFSYEPYWIDRLVRLRQYAQRLRELNTEAPSLAGAIPLPHGDIRARSVFIVHGRARGCFLRADLVQHLHGTSGAGSPPSVKPRAGSIVGARGGHPCMDRHSDRRRASAD